MDLRKGDCLKILPEIEAKSIDLFLLDLPYGQTACKWDSIIDLKEMWVQIKRTMKPNAVIVFFCTTKFGYKLIQSNEKWFRYDLIWEKSRKVGFLSANKMPLRKHENVYVFKDKGGTYNPQKTEGEPYDRCPENSNEWGKIKEDNYLRKKGKGFEFKPVKNDGTRHPTSILPEFKEHENVYVFKDKGGTYNPQKTTGHKTRIRSHNKNADIDHCVYGDKLKIQPEDTTEERHPTSLLPDFETTILKHNNPPKSLHKTQKPVSLCEWLVKTYSNEGDLVCDFCMGSGTVGVACKNTNRKFLGIEMDDEIFDVAKNRIESHN